MLISVLGGGWYGCHIALDLALSGHSVRLLEIAPDLFSGASGSIPARVHDGYHYPRSAITREACQRHRVAFLARYGHLTRSVARNIYAVAETDSLVDFGTYRQVLAASVSGWVEVNPADVALHNVEGAVLTQERHIVPRLARQYFREALTAAGVSLYFNGELPDEPADNEIDCTFCSQSSVGVARYEPCVTGLLQGDSTDVAVTIMDGPFPSLYPWDEEFGLSSITSAKWTPLGRFDTYEEASQRLRSVNDERDLVHKMCQQLRHWYPRIDAYKFAGARLSIRAIQASAADSRTMAVRVDGKTLRVRAGKIDAVIEAGDKVRGLLCSM